MRVTNGSVFFALAFYLIVLCEGQLQDNYEDPIEICMQKFNWTPDRLQYVHSNGPNRDLGCWNSCLLHQSGVMANNKYSEEEFKKQWEIEKKIKEMEYNCIIKANKLNDPCEVANYYDKCFEESINAYEAQTKK